MKLGSTSFVVVAIAAEAFISASASSSPLSNNALHHRGLLNKVKRAVGAREDANKVEARSALEKRKAYSGTATLYVDDLSEGACGVYTAPSNYIVAMNLPNYGNQDGVSSWCGKQLEISYGGVTKTATVADCCASCHGDGDLDMSTGLFTSFGVSIGTGEFDITWSVAGSGGSSSSNDNNDNEKTTTTHHTHATSTHTTHTTPSSTKPITSTSLSTITMSSSSSSLPTSSSATVSASVTTPAVPASSTSATTSTQGTAQNLQDISDVFSGLLNIANAVQG